MKVTKNFELSKREIAFLVLLFFYVIVATVGAMWGASNVPDTLH